ncbi:MAG: porin [Cyclobacteriaceae bacterium]|jgi:phosphate-selective porin OprO/OprP|nr:porin [Cyclobacteriaceae bacterium]
MVMTFMMHHHSIGQEKNEYIPDGTQGEQLEVLDSAKLPAKWRDKRWRLFPGRYSTFKFGGGFLYEFAGYSQDETGKRQMDSIGSALEPQFAVRDFRITASGQLKTKRIISWKLGLMYDGPSRSWFVRETGIMIDVPELWGKFFIGRTKEGFSMNKVMVGYAGWTMERQMAIDVIPILADGLKWLGFLPKQRIFWNLGMYGDWLSKTQSFSTFHRQVAVRAGWLPVYSASDGKVLHVGVNYRYGEPVNNEMRLSSRPEANPAPKFIDTEKFASNYSNHFGGEAYFNSGPWMIGSEMYMHRFNSSAANDPVFVGGDVVVSYMITGETRPYHTTTGILGFVPVKRPAFKGGPGAWEVLIRASTLDLNGGNLQGGKFWRITPMVNWYLSKDVRFELAYGYGVLDRFNLNGTTHFFQSRIQFTLL